MPFPQMMNRFGPQMPPQMPPQFQQPPQFNPMNMPPRFPPFLQQNQMTQMNIPQPPPQIRIPFQIPQQQQVPMMSPPRPEVPQFRLISPAPQQQQMPNFNRPQEIGQQEQEPQVRIQLRRIQIPGPIGDIFPFLNKIHNDVEKTSHSNEEEAPRPIQVQQMPLAIALSKVGITPDDLRNIQRMAEEKFQEHLRELVAEEANESSDSDSESTQSEEDNDSQNVNEKTDAPEQNDSEEMKKDDAELHEVQVPQEQQSEEQQPQILALDRSNFGRSLNPVQLPGRMPENEEAERADCKLFFIKKI